MSKKKANIYYDRNIIEALKKLPSPIEDKKHNLSIYVNNDQARSNESRFEHIAKSAHELKVKDIESIPEGILKYERFRKSTSLKDTYYYFIKRKNNMRGYIQLAVKLFEGDVKKAYIKTIFITYSTKWMYPRKRKMV